MGLAGLEQLDQLERALEQLVGVPARAAARCLPKLLAVVHAECAAGESAEGDPWDPLKAGGGTPITALTSQIAGHVAGSSVVITTPDELRFHQGGFVVHTGAAGERLKEAQAAAHEARALDKPDDLKAARKRVRVLKATIRKQATHVAKRPTLPTTRRALPIAWGRVIAQAFEDEIAATMKGIT